MRNLLYDCYQNGIKVKTVSTMKEAKEWKDENASNSVREKLVKVQPEESAEAQKKRLEMVYKRMAAIRAKKDLKK